MTDRRSFLKNTLLTSTGLLVLPTLSFDDGRLPDNDATTSLEQTFKKPPLQYAPKVFWMWMNGHITKQGITLDLQEMKQMGVGGAYIYNSAVGIPKGPVDYGSDLWLEMMLHAVTEAHALGLEISIHNAPGFSSTGAPGIPAELSMQQLVWSEALVDGGPINIELPQPLKKVGFYCDAHAIAFPALPGEQQLMRDKMSMISINGQSISKAFLYDDNVDTLLQLTGNISAPGFIDLMFDEPFEARAITIKRRKPPTAPVYDAPYDSPPVFTLQASDNGIEYVTVCSISMPALRFIDTPGIQSFKMVSAKFFRLTTTTLNAGISGFELHTSPRLPGWTGKTNLSEPEFPVHAFDVEERLTIDPSTVVDVSSFMQSNGTLNWNAPPGKWVIIRFGHTTTGAENAGAPASAQGLEIDKMNAAAAVNYYCSNFLDSMLAKLQPFISTTFTALGIDSWEVGRQNWTSKFTAEFDSRRKYDLVKWLPALTGRIVGNVQQTEQVLFDVRRTHADLVADNYYGSFKQYCHKHQLKLYSQPNGDGMFDSLQVADHLDLPMAEFWTGYVPGTLNLINQVVSAGHGYGKKVIAAEAYTGLPLTSRFTAYPYALKSQGDHVFTRGINQFVLHAFVHQPYSTGKPGMSMGPYGSHLDRNLTWISMAKPWVDYLSRSQFLLQQGVPVADVCYYKGEEPTQLIPDVNYTNPAIPTNIAGDVIGPNILLNRIHIDKCTIVIADQMRYRLMILAPLKTMSIEALSRLKQLVFEGMHLVVTTKPINTPGINNMGILKEFTHLINALYNDLDGRTVKERTYGKGKLYWNIPIQNILQSLKIEPDFTYTSQYNDASILYTHRQMGSTEIYFISNHLRRTETIVCDFRVSNKIPEILNAETGTSYKPAVYEHNNSRTYLPITLQPSGSLFVVFKQQVNLPAMQSIKRNGIEILTAQPFMAAPHAPFTDVQNNFTISLWIKPDSYAYDNKGIIIFPPEGEVVYGDGHTACGLAAGQNIIRVFERDKGPNRNARPMITSLQPLSGFKHVVVRYLSGKPSLFVNSVLVAEGNGSGKTVHPGLYTSPTGEILSAGFEGNYTRPILYKTALSSTQIKSLYNKGLPPPEPPLPIEFTRNTLKGLQTIFWQNGAYAMYTKTRRMAVEISGCTAIDLNNKWKVDFTSYSTAPKSIVLDRLMSLHLHDSDEVKYFSGMAQYTTQFTLERAMLQPAKQILLQLGRVEVIAEIFVNNIFAGTLWKEPYQLQITKLLKPGVNQLQVKVVNLWVNRLIGDSTLPAEDKFDDNGIIKELPAWYINEQAKPNGRSTFSVFNNFKPTDPLTPSGLLGPVKLYVGISRSYFNKI